MITIFNFISDILFTKKKTCLNNIDAETVFQPFILNRWISMYSSLLALQSNILNKYLAFSPNKQDIYNLFFNFFNRVPQRKITYYKKNKESSNNNEEDKIKLYAKSMELSEREIADYTNMLTNLKNS